MENKHYDYLIVGSGLSGASACRLLLDKGYKVLVIEKRNHVGGNVYTEIKEDIPIHVYGPHIFHTDSLQAWEFFNKYSSVEPFINSPLAFYKGKTYHMPFNMNTFHELWGVSTADEARAIIDKEIAKEGIHKIKNLEDQALSLAGRTIYETLIKGYTEKQWGRPCKKLPSSIIKRLPLRFEYNNNYFNDKYQGEPIGGYTPFIENLLKGADIILNADYLEDKQYYDSLADKVIYTGRLDEFFSFELGYLQWRSLRFEVKRFEVDHYQANPVINFTDKKPSYTRIAEHKYFEKDCKNHYSTYISEEYPDEFEEGKIPYYTINDERNNKLAASYLEKAKQIKNVHFLGRLATYRYLDMDDAITEAFALVDSLTR